MQNEQVPCCGCIKCFLNTKFEGQKFPDRLLVGRSYKYSPFNSKKYVCTICMTYVHNLSCLFITRQYKYCLLMVTL